MEVHARTDEVDDEPPVPVAAGVAAEEGGAVGRPRDVVEDGVPSEDDGVVARVCQGVAEAEDGLVARGVRGGRDHRLGPREGEEQKQGSAYELVHPDRLTMSDVETWAEEDGVQVGLRINKQLLC